MNFLEQIAISLSSFNNNNINHHHHNDIKYYINATCDCYDSININDFAYWYRCYRFVVCLFVCHSRSCIVLKWLKIST